MVQVSSVISLIPCAILSGCDPSHVPTGEVRKYHCADGREFSVERDPYEAVVRYANERHVLPRRPSSEGVKYASTEATLLITGRFAAFASETIVELKRCSVTR